MPTVVTSFKAEKLNLYAYRKTTANIYKYFNAKYNVSNFYFKHLLFVFFILYIYILNY